MLMEIAVALSWTFAANDVAGELVTLNDNGGWCWFQDERAVIYDGALYVGSVANKRGEDGLDRFGNIEVVRYDLETGHKQRAVLHEQLDNDDHAVPALLVMPDGRLLTMYATHGRDEWMRYRFTEEPGDISSWTAEEKIDAGAACTYSNLFRLESEEGRLYNFHRGRGWDPNYLVSNDGGRHWAYGGKLLENANDPEGKVRPYVKYASNGVDTIHFVATEAHPQQYPPGTSLYHGYVRRGHVHRSDGTDLGDLDEGPVAPESLTRIFEGDETNAAWVSDVALDDEDRPYVLYSVHKSDEDHRYRYARWDGEAWHDQEIAYAGTKLYEQEKHYTGLGALDPDDLNTVYISTDADPVTGEPLISEADDERHYEIFRGETDDQGATWDWTPVTWDSTVDNLRPIVPTWDGQNTAVLWLRGDYKAYRVYDQKVVGLMETK